MSSDITVVIPTFNRPKMVIRAIESAYAQTLQPDYIIVIDDGKNPVPETKRLLEPNLTWIKTSRPDQCYLSWYEATNLSKTKYVMILADDDWIEPTYLETAKSMFADDVAFVFSQAKIHFENGRTALNFGTENGTGYYSNQTAEDMLLRIELVITPHCCMFRREDLLTSIIVGPFPGRTETHMITAGNDLLMTLLTLLNPKYKLVGYIDKPLVNLDGWRGSVTIDAMSDPKKYEDLKLSYKEARDFYRKLKCSIS